MSSPRLILLAVLGVVFAAASARGDTLDEALLREGPSLVKKLKASGHVTVGTLPFALKIGDRNSETNGGAINVRLADYLEAALLLSNVLDKSLVILRESAAAAVTVEGGRVDTPAGRAALLARDYRTWVGDGKARRPDAFLTGRIDLAADLTRAVVHVCVLSGPTDLKLLHKIEVKVDQFLLSDCGIGVSFTHRDAAKRSFSRDIFDEVIKDDIGGADVKIKTPLKPTLPDGTQEQRPNPKKPMDLTSDKVTSVPLDAAKSANSFPLDFRVLYDDQAQVEEVELGNPGLGVNPTTYRIRQPKETQVIVLKMKNLRPQAVGVVVLVGGVSTMNGHSDWKDSEKWVLVPQIEYTLRGYYATASGKDTVVPFKVMSASESRSLYDRRGESAGRIEVHVFQEIPADTALRYSAGVSLRIPGAVKDKPDTIDLGASLEVVKTMGQRLSGKGLIAPAATGVDTTLARSELPPNTGRTDSKIIKYYSHDDK